MSKSKRTGKATASVGRSRKKSREVTRIPLRGGEYQNTLFPVEIRPESEVRADQEREVLDDRVPPAVLDDLRTRAKRILEDVQRWQMAQSEKPHRYSWGPGVKRFYTAEESVLSELVETIATAAFKAAADRYRAEIASLVARLEKQNHIRAQRRENGEILAEDGREKRRTITDKRTATICKQYAKVRGRFPAGSRGNGQAIREVCRRVGPLPGRENVITAQAVRDALKRSGIVCE